MLYNIYSDGKFLQLKRGTATFAEPGVVIVLFKHAMPANLCVVTLLMPEEAGSYDPGRHGNDGIAKDHDDAGQKLSKTGNR